MVAFVNANWVNFNINPEAGVAATVIFDGDRLWGLLLSFHLPSDDARQWTEQLEHLRKARHDEWLNAELGTPPYRYVWGEITSDFDPRACASEIVLRYAD